MIVFNLPADMERRPVPERLRIYARQIAPKAGGLRLIALLEESAASVGLRFTLNFTGSSMNRAKVAVFLRQPSTVLGLSTLVGLSTAFATGQLTWQSAVPAIAGALAAIALPDNSGAQAAIKDAAAAAVQAEQAIVPPSGH